MSTPISTRLVSLRKDKNLSQKEAASALGVSQGLLSHYEKGIRECGLDFLCRAAAFYDVSADYLLGLSDTKMVSGALFDLTEIPQDSEMRTSTLFRAYLFLMEKMSANGKNNAERVKMIYILTLYKIYIGATELGFFPKGDLRHPEIASFLSASTIDHILTLFNSPADLKPKKSDSAPKCIGTVVNEAEKLIENQLEMLSKANKRNKSK